MSSACFIPHVLVVQWLCWLDRYMSSACFTQHVLLVVVEVGSLHVFSLSVFVVEVGSLHVFSLFYTTCLSGCGRGWIATCLQPVLYHMSQWLWQRLDRYMSSACFTPHVLVVVVEVGSLHVFSLFYTMSQWLWQRLDLHVYMSQWLWQRLDRQSSLFYTTCLSGCGRGWIATCLQPVLPHVLVVVVEVGSLHVFSVLYHMSQWLWQRLDRYMSSACFTPHVLVVVVEVGSLHVFSLFYTTCLSG